MDAPTEAEGKQILLIARSACVRLRGKKHPELDDLISITVLSVLESWKSYDRTRNLSTWVNTIAHRRCADRDRAAGRRPQRLLGEDEDVPKTELTKSPSAWLRNRYFELCRQRMTYRGPSRGKPKVLSSLQVEALLAYQRKTKCSTIHLRKLLERDDSMRAAIQLKSVPCEKVFNRDLARIRQEHNRGKENNFPLAE